MKIRKIIVFAVIYVVTVNTAIAKPPSWVQSYGSLSRYSGKDYLTGFAQMRGDNAREAARDAALVDLAGKIRTEVQSELVQINAETDGVNSSSVSQVTRNSVEVSVSGANFDYYEDRGIFFALASTPRSALTAGWIAQASRLWEEVGKSTKSSQRAVEGGRSGQALRVLDKAITNFHSIYEYYTLIRAVGGKADTFFSALNGVNSLDDLQKHELEIKAHLEGLENRLVGSPAEAVGMLAVSLERQGAQGGQMQVPPLLFEATTFSSEFGRYFSQRLASALVKALPAGDRLTVFSGQYWEEDGNIRLIVLASAPNGAKIARSEAVLPQSSIGGYSLKPQGYNEAMTALREFADGAISDGGINVDVWTNKGRDRDALVFEADEEVQFYFRVNQPAFLRISYRLSGGEIVLLEDGFYIGSDRVNRTVELPYTFEVVPPFGVENLIVTAFSVKPPPPATIPKRIDGELYQVFNSVKKAISASRGLRRKQGSEVRVGEVMLTLTTMRGEK